METQRPRRSLPPPASTIPAIQLPASHLIQSSVRFLREKKTKSTVIFKLVFDLDDDLLIFELPQTSLAMKLKQSITNCSQSGTLGRIKHPSGF